MADAAISFAVQKLGDALIHKVRFLKSVEDHVRWLKDELQNMQCFLKDASEKQGSDERVRKWISDVREVAQDAEDAIEMFNLKVDTPRRKRGLLVRCAGFLFHGPHLNRLGMEIKSIRTRLDEIVERRGRYGIGNLREVGLESSSRRRWEMVEWRRRMAARFQRDKDVVGLDEDTDFLLRKVILDQEKKGLSLASIVGMGGIGKSTLARKIYNHPGVAVGFELRAWVVVSSEFAAEDIIYQIMLQLPMSPDADKLKGDEGGGYMEKLKVVESVRDKLRRQEILQEMLRQRLEGKSYFIVLDDVWEHAHWEALTTAFPDQQDKASRLLFTSRNQIIKKRQGYIHNMRLLNPDESWELLLKTAFLGRTERCCPQELEDIGREILKKCHGLPLAITVAGGLLVNQGECERGWERVLKQIKNYHLETSEIGSNVSAILELSYHNLPSQLKPCFLCLAFFKEDAVIRAKRLVHIWVALGLIKAQEAGEEAVEETALTYLDELINRNLVQVKGMSIDDRVKHCHVHDLLRELSIKKAKEEIGFESLVTESDQGSSSSNKPRHRVVRGTAERPIITGSWNQNKHLRSLFLHVEAHNDDYFSSPSYWESFQLLRILDIEGTRFPTLPSTIRALIGLRYLRLREERGELKLPSWLDLLKNLEVLDLANSECVTLPDVTWKMDSLRHFYIDSRCIFSDSMKISTWKYLETLKYIRSDYFLSDNPTEGYSLRLRKVGVELVGRIGEAEMGRLLVESAVQVLHIRWMLWIYDDLPFPNYLYNLTKLKLHGRMSWCPSADKFPRNISHLTLSESQITSNDPMQELGKLPKLLFLKLNDWIEAKCDMKVSYEGFPRLKVLHLTRMYGLRSIKVEEGGMAELQRLEIYKCPNFVQTENLRKRLTSTVITTLN